ncbi:MAG: hypothetical protein K2M91_01135 [Lachnospiraceae bacterium]|nr:hypothetical protein [Lachnospiraceae bacterium]
MDHNYNLCFVLGYEVENKTEFHRKLVDLFGVWGTVRRNKEGEVEDFNVVTNYGIIRLIDPKVLQLEIRIEEISGRLTSVQIEELYRKLKDASIIQSDSPWFISSSIVFEVI